MAELVTAREAEAFLEQKYVGKICSFKYPGYKTVYGMVDQIAIETIGVEPLVIIQMNDRRYTCSPENLRECLILLKK